MEASGKIDKAVFNVDYFGITQKEEKKMAMKPATLRPRPIVGLFVLVLAACGSVESAPPTAPKERTSPAAAPTTRGVKLDIEAIHGPRATKDLFETMYIVRVRIENRSKDPILFEPGRAELRDPKAKRVYPSLMKGKTMEILLELPELIQRAQTVAPGKSLRGLLVFLAPNESENKTGLRLVYGSLAIDMDIPYSYLDRAAKSATVPQGWTRATTLTASRPSRYQAAERSFTCSFRSPSPLAIHAICKRLRSEEPMWNSAEDVGRFPAVIHESVTMPIIASAGGEVSLTTYFPGQGAYLLTVWVWEGSVSANRGAVYYYYVDASGGYASRTEVYASRIEESLAAGEADMDTRYLGLRGHPAVIDSGGRTPLHCATEHGWKRAMDWLLGTQRLGKDLDLQDNAGVTPLMLAAASGDAVAVRTLIDAGAAGYPVSDEGKTVADYAKTGGSAEAAALIAKISAPVSEKDLATLGGVWEGTILAAQPRFVDKGYACRLTARRVGKKFIADAVLGYGLTRADMALVERGKAAEIKGFNKAVLESKFDIFLQGKKVYGVERRQKTVLKGVFDPVPLRFAAELTDDGYLVGLSKLEDPWSNCFFMKPLTPIARRPSDVPVGKTVKLTCRAAPEFHYNCYLPVSYDPSRPAPVLVFDGAGGNAAPLSPAAAEELGWISVGLVESSNTIEEAQGEFRCEACAVAVLVDLQERFSVDTTRFYFGGSSGGTIRSHIHAAIHGKMTAGVIDIARGMADSPLKGIPTFYIQGRKDVPDFIDDFPSLKADVGGIVELREHPGGHLWWFPEFHAEAMRWLDGLSRGAAPR
jgi:hypothetical protein